MSKKIILVLSLFLIMFAACLPPETPQTIVKEGSVMVSVPARNTSASTAADALGVTNYTVVLFNQTMNSPKVLTPGETALFEKLAPGDYSLQVTATDSNDLTVLAGVSNVTVVAGETTNALVTLSHTTGNVSVEIILPAPIQ